MTKIRIKHVTPELARRFRPGDEPNVDMKEAQDLIRRGLAEPADGFIGNDRAVDNGESICR